MSLCISWPMRMRLIESIKRHPPKFFAGTGASVQLDETYLRESFKGNHTRGRFRFPRGARHRVISASKRGLSKEQICVMTGVADDSSAFLSMSGWGVISKNRALTALDGKIARGTYAVADQASAYPGAMEALGVAVTRTKAEAHAINHVNTLRSLFDGFMACLPGVSPKRLNEYLTWFLWRRTFHQNQADVTARQVNVTPCDNTVRDWAHVLLPYMDYWGEAA